MTKDSLFINYINKFLIFSQTKCKFLWENSFFMQNIDNLIFATIIAVLVLSTFASSDIIGYVSLITIFLTIIKILVKQGEKLEINLFETFLLLYFLIVIVSLAGSSLFHLSIKGFFKTFTYLGFYASAVQYYKNNLSKILTTIFVISFCAGIQGVLGIFQNFIQVGEISTWQDITNINPEDVMTRVYGTLRPYNPNLFGGYLVASLPCLFGGAVLSIFSKKNKLAVLFALFALITSFTLILSGCRGAYIGFAVIIICLFGFSAKFIWESGIKWLKKLFLSAIGLAAVFISSLLLFVSSIRMRVLSIFAMRADSSTSFRLNVYQSAIQMAKDNWLLGIGIGNQNFREIYGLYMKTGFDALSAYNVFLEISIESGIFALIAFLLFILTTIIKSIKFIFETKNLNAAIIVATALTSAIAIMVHGFVDTVFFRPQIQFIFWIMIAFITANLNPKNYDCSNGKKSENNEI